MQKLLFLLLLMGTLLMACNKDLSPEEQLAKDKEDIEKYLKDKGLTAKSTASSLYYIITEEGSGSNPTVNNTVTVKYKGYLLDGSVFDQTTGAQTATFPLSQVIPGWQEGIPLFKKSGKGTLLIPSYLAYGPQSVGSIPSNSPLVFEIELVDFK
jgi:FKBP-type peptidyl-prolyl cis-trans isomerase FkpA